MSFQMRTFYLWQSTWRSRVTKLNFVKFSTAVLFLAILQVNSAEKICFTHFLRVRALTPALDIRSALCDVTKGLNASPGYVTAPTSLCLIDLFSPLPNVQSPTRWAGFRKTLALSGLAPRCKHRAKILFLRWLFLILITLLSPRFYNYSKKAIQLLITELLNYCWLVELLYFKSILLLISIFEI